uniref:DUF4346 domain-containing protein n=1 Tax=Galaxaura rugosa TaxID=268570 RepID=A0A1G4NSR9_9FLOR|nr:Hypothetical protein ORF_1 [Galaxaura rugosa]SCW21723.1 Hypothetical protein ORF_1 [Galaxaura rugosa]
MNLSLDKLYGSCNNSPNSLNHFKVFISTNNEIIDLDIYCVININKDKQIYCIVYYRSDKKNSLDKSVIFKSKKAKRLSQLIQLHNCIYQNLSVSHAIYIGMELMKAEISVIVEQSYIQD